MIKKNTKLGVALTVALGLAHIAMGMLEAKDGLETIREAFQSEEDSDE